MAAIITDIGLTKLATASPLVPLEITHVAFGDNNNVWPKLLDPTATSLTNEVYRSDASDPIKTPSEPQILIFEGSIPGTVGGFTLREMAIFDVDGDMIAIGDIDQIVKPVPASGNSIILTQRLHVKFSSTSDVELIAQDVAVSDHQGLSNRTAVDAHPASSISTLALSAIGQGVSNVQSILGLLKSAALRAVGTGGSDIPDTDELNTRLATTGNLGNAATRTVQSSLSDPTFERLMLNGGHGLGGEAITITNMNGTANSKFIYANNPTNAPESNSVFRGVHIQSGTSSSQVIVSGSNNLYFRNGTGVWFAALPPGTMSLFAGTTVPNGYLATNGAAVSRITYSTLFDVIGTSYGAGDGSTTFNVPNDTDPTYLKCIKY